MKPLACLVGLILVVAACDSRQGSFSPTRPSTLSPPPVTPPSPMGLLVVNQVVTGLFVGQPLYYQLTAPSTGTLRIQLTWDPTLRHLTLSIGEVRAAPVAPDWSPVNLRMPVTAGQTYLVQVDTTSPWDYGIFETFSLLAQYEQAGDGAP